MEIYMVEVLVTEELRLDGEYAKYKGYMNILFNNLKEIKSKGDLFRIASMHMTDQVRKIFNLDDVIKVYKHDDEFIFVVTHRLNTPNITYENIVELDDVYAGPYNRLDTGDQVIFTDEQHLYGIRNNLGPRMRMIIVDNKDIDEDCMDSETAFNLFHRTIRVYGDI